MKKVLIVAYFWPYREGSGRVIGLVKYLPEFGWQPTILTASLHEKPAPQFRVIETSCPPVLGFWKRLFGFNLNQSIETQVKERLGITSEESFKKSFLAFFYSVASEIVHYPDAEIRGIDINPMAVQKGNEWFAQEGISNVRLSVGKADELEQFRSKSFDVVFTDAVLIYIGRDKIRRITEEMVRVTREGLFLVEWHCFEPEKQDPYGLGVRHHGLWKRDYIALLKQFVPAEQIHITKLTEALWPDKNWKELGAVVEVVI